MVPWDTFAGEWWDLETDEDELMMKTNGKVLIGALKALYAPTLGTVQTSTEYSEPPGQGTSIGSSVPKDSPSSFRLPTFCHMHRNSQAPNQKEPTKRILAHFNVFEVPTIPTIKREGAMRGLSRTELKGGRHILEMRM